MQHKTTIHVANQEDLVAAKLGNIRPDEVRQVTIKGAIVDTGATRLSLPQSIVDSLGLTPTDTTLVHTTNGVVTRTLYSPVQFTVLDRKGIIEVSSVPDNVPALVGYTVMGLVDLDVSATEGLIHNPAHGGERTEYQL